MRQRPLAQRNSLGPHVGYSTARRPKGGEREREHPLACVLIKMAPISSWRSLTALQGLVGAVATVVVMVTDKVLGNALPVLAHELIAATRVIEHWEV